MAQAGFRFPVQRLFRATPLIACAAVLLSAGAAWARGPHDTVDATGVLESGAAQSLSGTNSQLQTSAEPPGANCPTGGTRLDVGTDLNGDGVLDATEIDPSQTRYICNGAQGPAGSTGVFGDGSGGSFLVNTGSVLDLTTPGGYAFLGGRQHLQFTNVSINGTLIVPSGTVFRTTGNFTVNPAGTLIVAASAGDNGVGPASQGVSRAPAGEPQGGFGLTQLQSAQLVRPGALGGGAGAKQAGVTGGSGGGSLVILAQGTVQVLAGGTINATGENGGTGSNLPGSGGGAGGVLVILGKTSVSVNGIVRASGGRGGDGNNTGGAGKGGGGGGGGGIIQLLSSTTPSVSGTLDVSGGAPGVSAAPTAPNTTIVAGGGGGACGGNGGNGGVTGSASTAGSAGYDLRTTTPTPENLFL
ncbi:collagen-like protein [Pyxidicoccus parkwayensis]|uniref:Collagen-like protein n=1 Tax=Pyxidicoccus parkwayensis TaxID=2813578 RepID=A0ABX7P641_9BACT|nr:collagen-like protein [Pyxidicoccus parkwaysis]QSQ25934.1 collagen-like protein [Pyxidicoccus parkwaysis]